MPPPILDIREFKKQFDPLFLKELERHIGKATQFTKDADCGALLAQVQEIALAGGKRIRPYISYLLYRTAGGVDETILEKLIAFELFHTFALIHDDIIDRGTVRHGKMTLHEFAQPFVGGSSLKGTHLADGLALLVGDLVFSWGRETFTATHPSQKAQELFDDMVYAVVLGQMLDVKIMCHADPTLEMILEKTLLKTTEYTFVYPMRIGAAFAGADEEYAEWCKEMGTSLGVAFQVQDDLLDIVGDEKLTGKKPLQDFAEGQHTVFTSYVREHGTQEQKERFNELFGGEVTDDVAREVQDIFLDTGAISYGKKIVADEITHARNILSQRTLEEGAQIAWENLLERMERRTA